MDKGIQRESKSEMFQSMAPKQSAGYEKAPGPDINDSVQQIQG
jgi:hypothetical protein|tara:strand:+ start:505 stop:633 length:129 start_codon:yes stop_codon:yes gene_type:complete